MSEGKKTESRNRWTRIFRWGIFFLFLGFLVIPIPALDPISKKALLDGLRKEIREKGYSFTVGDSPILDYPLEKLCGALPDETSLEKGKFESFSAGRELPSSFDWRDENAVTPIKWQGGCGACYAFARLGALESQILIREGVEVDLAEQLPVDCDTTSNGCVGGGINFFYLTSHGATMEAWYPYMGVETDCTGETISKPYKVTCSHSVENAVEAIKQAIYDHGPVICGVAADDAFWAYRSGIYDGEGAPQRNHVVMLTGWDDNEGYGYWILRNSWGLWWGEEGYMRIKYGVAKVGVGCKWPEYHPLPQPNLCQTDVKAFVTSFNENDPGGTAAIRLSLKNYGLFVDNITAFLSTDDSSVVITSDTMCFPDLSREEEATGLSEFTIALGPDIPFDREIEFYVEFRAGTSYVAVGRFRTKIDRPPALVLDMDSNHDSAPEIQTALSANRIDWAVTRNLDQIDLYDFQVIFICLGVGEDATILPAPYHELLRTALLLRTGVYLEGSAFWLDTSEEAVGLPWFNITGDPSGSDTLTGLKGQPDTYWEGLHLGIKNDACRSIRLSAANSGRVVFRNDSTHHGCGVANTEYAYNGGNYWVRTIGTSFEFGSQKDGEGDNTKVGAMRRILKFFRLANIPAGDLDDSGTVDAADLLLLAQLLSDNLVLSPIVEPDLDYDGRITSVDLGLLAGFLVEPE